MIDNITSLLFFGLGAFVTLVASIIIDLVKLNNLAKNNKLKHCNNCNNLNTVEKCIPCNNHDNWVHYEKDT